MSRSPPAPTASPSLCEVTAWTRGFPAPRCSGHGSQASPRARPTSSRHREQNPSLPSWSGGPAPPAQPTPSRLPSLGSHSPARRPSCCCCRAFALAVPLFHLPTPIFSLTLVSSGTCLKALSQLLHRVCPEWCLSVCWWQGGMTGSCCCSPPVCWLPRFPMIAGKGSVHVLLVANIRLAKNFVRVFLRHLNALSGPPSTRGGARCCLFEPPGRRPCCAPRDSSPHRWHR